MLVIHANWTANHLHLWAESLDKFSPNTYRNSQPTETSSNGHAVAVSEECTTHPYAVSSKELFTCLQNAQLDIGTGEETSLILKLPHDLLDPWPSDRLISIIGDY